MALIYGRVLIYESPGRGLLLIGSEGGHLGSSSLNLRPCHASIANLVIVGRRGREGGREGGRE